MEAAVEIPADVAGSFRIEQAVESGDVSRLSGGRTNRTMWVRGAEEADELVLQQLRGDANSDLLGVMENLVRVTAHLDWKQRVRRDPNTWWPLLVPTTAGKPFLMTDDGDVWRAFVYRPGRIARSALPHETLVGAATLFGRFSAETVDLGDPDLMMSTPGFHDLDLVWTEFESLIDAADREAAAPLLKWGDRIDAVRRELDRRMHDDGLNTVRHRVVHNDTKLSNVLLEQGGPEPIAVLDLDLAMMGPIWHDVGDLLRSAAWHSAVDGEPKMTPELFGAMTHGWCQAAAASTTASEVATFATAGPRLSLELGVRYLSDHLRQVPVLRVEGEDGHLRRGLANVKLAEEMLGAYDALRSLVDECVDLHHPNFKVHE